MKVNLELNPADQVHDLGLNIGDVIQSKTANGEDRLTLLWVGTSIVAWHRCYRRLFKRDWEDLGELVNYPDFHEACREWDIISPEELEKEKLSALLTAAYRVIATANGPEEMLDNLSAAASGKPFPHEPDAGIQWVPVCDRGPKSRVWLSVDFRSVCEELVKSITEPCTEEHLEGVLFRSKALLNAVLVGSDEYESRYLSLVFRDLSDDERSELMYHPKLSYAGVGHVFYERDDLKRMLSEQS